MARWVHSSTMATFPAPATSNGAGGFPALRFPVRFTPRVMRPPGWGALSASASFDGHGTRYTGGSVAIFIRGDVRYALPGGVLISLMALGADASELIPVDEQADHPIVDGSGP